MAETLSFAERRLVHQPFNFNEFVILSGAKNLNNVDEILHFVQDDTR